LLSQLNELKAEMEAILEQMAEAKNNERSGALKEVKRYAKSLALRLGCLRVREIVQHQVLSRANSG
jgi:response regulator RpfG family c-di-GMP phosphodiesterase